MTKSDIVLRRYAGGRVVEGERIIGNVTNDDCLLFTYRKS